jgi:hypothetical protein
VILNRTELYPEGRRQPSEISKLIVNGDEVCVIKVMKRGKPVFSDL